MEDARIRYRYIAKVLVLHPTVWPVALRQALRLAPTGWWHRWPPDPTPTAELWQFRLETAYGANGPTSPSDDDVISYLRWCARR